MTESTTTTTAPEPMAYIARKACGCFVWAGVDVPNRGKDNAKEAAWAMKKGYTVERVTCQYVRENWRSSCAVCALVAQEAMGL